MRAVKFYWGVDSRQNPIFIEERGDGAWAIIKGGNCFSRELDWEYEPMPSGRDEEFLVRCRFNSSEEAKLFIEAAYDEGKLK